MWTVDLNQETSVVCFIWLILSNRLYFYTYLIYITNLNNFWQQQQKNQISMWMGEKKMLFLLLLSIIILYLYIMLCTLYTILDLKIPLVRAYLHVSGRRLSVLYCITYMMTKHTEIYPFCNCNTKIKVYYPQWLPEYSMQPTQINCLTQLEGGGGLEFKREREREIKYKWR